MYSSNELFQPSQEGYFIKITLGWAQKQFITGVQTLFDFLHDITNP